MSSLLEMRSVSQRYGATAALTDVDLTVDAGEVRALMGENGAGKSTLLKILSGVLRPDSGEMEIAGERVDLRRLTTGAARGHGIAIVHQEFSLVPSMSVAENIFLGREPHAGLILGRRAMRSRAAELLQRVRSAVNPDTPVERLSIADAQLVEIAKALAGDVRVLALDEPSAVLSGDELQNLFGIVRQLRADGVGILYVSHRLDEVFSLADSYTVLKDGVVSGSGPIASTDADRLVSLMVGRSVSQIFPEARRPPGEVMLRLEQFEVPGLSEAVELELRAGEIVGVAGLQGSGRTRLAKGIFGAIPSSGVLEVDASRRAPLRSPAEAIQAGIAYVPEDRKSGGLALEKTVAWNLSMLSLRSLRGRGQLIKGHKEKVLVAGAVESMSIKTARDGSDVVGRLSGGNQQKVVVGKWLALEPRVIIFDEPTRGIDVGAKEQIYSILRELADRGVAIMLISSELIEVLGLSDRILVMSDGRVVGELPGAGATEEDIMRLVAGGTRPVAKEAS